MSSERARECGEDWAAAHLLRGKRCQIAQYPTSCMTPVAPPCGQPARWWSDDFGPTTVWMCKACCDEQLMMNDGLAVEEID